MYDEKKHRKFLRERRLRALSAVLCYENGYGFRMDFGVIRWFTTMIKAVICLILEREETNTRGKECLATYDSYFNVDHYNWMSVYVNPNWLKNWKVSIVFDGE